MKKNKKLFFLGIVVLLYLVILIPLLVITLQMRQDPRSRAAVSPTPTVCGNVATDNVIIIDRSSSMQGTKLAEAKTAAKLYVDQLATNPNNRVSLVTFAGTGSINVPLTSNFAQVKTAIDGLSTSGGTCIECGIKKASAEVTAHGRAGIKKVSVLLSDGKATRIEGSSTTVTEAVANQAATTAAQAAFNTHQLTFYTIGLGTDVNGPFLTSLATLSGGKYFFSPTSAQLAQIYQEISQLIGKGSIAGLVFNDNNSNGVVDQGEATLSGWNVELVSSSGTTSLTSTANGFTFSGLCDGNYTVKMTLQSGWQQTTPSNPATYSITISNGNVSTNKNFGVKLIPTPTFSPTPTPTSTPTPTPLAPMKLSFTLFLDGLGNRGDNANPTAHSLSNKNPQHPTKITDVQIVDPNNQIVASGSGNVTYSTANGNFTGLITLNNTLPTGPYLIKVRTEKYLRKQVSGIHSLTAGQTNVVPVTALIAGDITRDNTLSILDYNLLLDCYSDKTPAPDCADPHKKTASDINDDNAVNHIDYNLFLREISVQLGD